MNYGKKSLQYRKKHNVLKICSIPSIKNRDDLSVFYTPGIASVSLEIVKDKNRARELTNKKNSVAIISDGSAVLGLGNIGPEAAIPVMEGKALLFSEFAGIDAFPICLATQKTKEIIQIVKNLTPSFGGINLEDISAPRCFEIERKLQDIGIPVMHDDQHGTAVVTLAGLINALQVVKKEFSEIKIVISGAGAAGTAISKMIFSFSNEKCKIIVFDREGSVYVGRPGLSKEKALLAKKIKNKSKGTLEELIIGADVFIGVSAPNILTEDMVKSMNKDAIVFAMANPIPEIGPDLAIHAGASIVATGRSDMPNQLNNVLAFPGIFRGALDSNTKKITQEMLLAAAKALAGCVKTPNKDKIIPHPFDKNVVINVSNAVRQAATKNYN